MNALVVQLRVTSVRSRGRFGGTIFSGVTEEGTHYVAVCDYSVIPDSGMIDKGQQWLIQGVPSTRKSVTDSGHRMVELQIAVTNASLLRPSGKNIISWIADCPDCPGVGRVKATKLYERFGPSALVEHIEHRNIGALAEVINEESAQRLCGAFDKHKVANVLLWLDQVGVQRRIGASVVAYYKEQAQAKIEANPYVLVSFEANWRSVDEMARRRFGVTADDSRRLESAVEEALYEGLKGGHTCLPTHDVKRRLITLLGSSQLVEKAISNGAVPQQCYQINGSYQAAGAYLVEQYVARRLREMLIGEQENGQMPLFARIKANTEVADAAILAFERLNHLKLTREQRDAVLTSAFARVSLILGGAGTGKTTVLKALYSALEALQPALAIHQIALSGRAAQRMAQATGRESQTIAGFLAKIDPRYIDIGSVIVVDEMSMVDVILMYRLLRHLPLGIRLVLVGDPSQLPPIGPGLVLHALAQLPSVPQVELKVVKRQSAMTGIPKVASLIRYHQAPEWAHYRGKPDTGVSFLPCEPTNLEEATLRVYAELGGSGSDYNVQILSITNGNIGGVNNLNAKLHNCYQQKSKHVLYQDREFGIVGASTLNRVPVKVGDLVMYTENDYGLGLRNGSLGRVIEALPVDNPEAPCCRCEFEGIEYCLTTKNVQLLTHAYAITVHKSQGSQFTRVIVPIRWSRLLDQTLIYTAVTRGVEQVVLIGNEQVLNNAIRAPASATQRHIALPELLKATTSR